MLQPESGHASPYRPPARLVGAFSCLSRSGSGGIHHPAPQGSSYSWTRIRATVHSGGGMTVSDAEIERIVNLVLNAVQILGLAYIAARYRNGSGKNGQSGGS